MSDAIAYVVSGEIQASEDWYAWNFDRTSGYLQTEEDWYSWNFERSPIQLEIHSEIATLSFSTTAIYDSESIELTLEIGSFSAVAVDERIVPSARSYRKPKKNASASIIPIDLTLEVGNLLASGTIIINNSAKIFGIEARIEAKAVKAEGVLNLSDEEIILLMAA